MNVIEVPLDHKMFDSEFTVHVGKFIYDEFGLLLTTSQIDVIGLYVFFESMVDGTQIQLVELAGNLIEDCIYYDIKLDNTSEVGFNVFCNSHDLKYINIGYDIAILVLRTIAYIMSAQRKRIAKPSKGDRPENDNKSENQKDDKIFLLDDIVEYVSTNGLSNLSGKTHTINCPCWSVRGHYRHYKNGKVIFVENYEKGKEKGKTIPKEKTYVI